jgi:antitoxin component YwqK of YwqJK toxin-antitoxin module
MTFLETPVNVDKTILNEIHSRGNNILPSWIFSIYIHGFNFYEGLNIKTIIEQTNGLDFYLNGRFEAYYANGQQMCDWFFENGKATKRSKVYRENGKLLYEWKIHKNYKKGTLIIYENDGSIKHSRKL